MVGLTLPMQGTDLTLVRELKSHAMQCGQEDFFFLSFISEAKIKHQKGHVINTREGRSCPPFSFYSWR